MHRNEHKYKPAGEFDLRYLAREVARTSDSADPATVAEEVLAAIPEEHTAEALRVAIGALVRQVITNMRPAASRSWYEYKKAPNRRAAWHRQMLRSRVALSTDERNWKFLGDCERADVLRAAEIRRSQAEANLRRAEQLEAVAEKLRINRATTVSDLDLGTLEECFRDALEQRTVA